jgi:hypothetical protein
MASGLCARLLPALLVAKAGSGMVLLYSFNNALHHNWVTNFKAPALHHTQLVRLWARGWQVLLLLKASVDVSDIVTQRLRAGIMCWQEGPAEDWEASPGTCIRWASRSTPILAVVANGAKIQTESALHDYHSR